MISVCGKLFGHLVMTGLAANSVRSCNIPLPVMKRPKQNRTSLYKTKTPFQQT